MNSSMNECSYLSIPICAISFPGVEGSNHPAVLFAVADTCDDGAGVVMGLGIAERKLVKEKVTLYALWKECVNGFAFRIPV
jgi:hypothetical protein